MYPARLGFSWSGIWEWKNGVSEALEIGQIGQTSLCWWTLGIFFDRKNLFEILLPFIENTLQKPFFGWGWNYIVYMLGTINHWGCNSPGATSAIGTTTCHVAWQCGIQMWKSSMMNTDYLALQQTFNTIHKHPTMDVYHSSSASKRYLCLGHLP